MLRRSWFWLNVVATTLMFVGTVTARSAWKKKLATKTKDDAAQYTTLN
jgi:hypothetical protein